MCASLIAGALAGGAEPMVHQERAQARRGAPPRVLKLRRGRRARLGGKPLLRLVVVLEGSAQRSVLGEGGLEGGLLDRPHRPAERGFELVVGESSSDPSPRMSPSRLMPTEARPIEWWLGAMAFSRGPQPFAR